MLAASLKVIDALLCRIHRPPDRREVLSPSFKHVIRADARKREKHIAHSFGVPLGEAQRRVPAVTLIVGDQDRDALLRARFARDCQATDAETEKAHADHWMAFSNN